MESSGIVAIVIACVAAASSLGVGIFTYKAGTKQTSTEADTKRIDQVIEGMQKIIDNLSKENQRLAVELDKLRDQLLIVKEDLNKSEVERVKAVRDLDTLTEKYKNLKARLQDKHVINGDVELI